MVAEAIDRTTYQIGPINREEQMDRIGEADAAGVKSVPGKVFDDPAFYINFVVSIDDLKNN